MKKVIILFVVLMLIVNTFRTMNNVEEILSVNSVLELVHTSFETSAQAISTFNYYFYDLKVKLQTMNEHFGTDAFRDLLILKSDPLSGPRGSDETSGFERRVINYLKSFWETLKYLFELFVRFDINEWVNLFRLAASLVMTIVSFITVLCYALYDVFFFIINVLGYMVVQ